MSKRKESTTVNESTAAQEVTVGGFDGGSAVNETLVIVKTLQKHFNERIDGEIGIIVCTVENRIQNAYLTAEDSIITPKIELATRLKNESSGRDATSVIASSERGENIEITAFFENVSETKNTLHVLYTNDDTRNEIPDEVPDTHFDRKPHTLIMVTGQRTQRDQVPELLTGKTLTQSKQQSHQQQNLSTQISNNINLPLVDPTAKKLNSD